MDHGLGALLGSYLGFAIALPLWPILTVWNAGSLYYPPGGPAWPTAGFVAILEGLMLLPIMLNAQKFYDRHDLIETGMGRRLVIWVALYYGLAWCYIHFFELVNWLSPGWHKVY